MDRGPLERNESSKIKATIARGEIKKRRGRSSSSFSSPQVENNESNFAWNSSTATDPATMPTPSITPEGPHSRPYNATAHPISGAQTGMLIPDGDTPIMSSNLGYFLPSPTADFAFTLNNEGDQQTGFDDPFPLEGFTTRHFGVLEMNSEVASSTIPASTKRATSVIREWPSEPQSHQSIDSLSDTETDKYTDLSLVSLSSTSTNRAQNDGEGCHRTKSVETLCAQDAILLSYYIENVLRNQFTFRTNVAGESIMWMEVLLLCSDPVRNACLILGRAQYNFDHSDGSQLSNDYHRDLQRMTKVLESLLSPTTTMCLFDRDERASHTIAACASLVQTIFLEVSSPVST